MKVISNLMPHMRLHAKFTSVLLALLSISSGFAQSEKKQVDKNMTALQLIELAASGSAELAQAITTAFNSEALQSGSAWSAHGPDFFFAAEASSAPELFIDDRPGPRMHQIEGSKLWYAAAKIQPLGTLHSYFYTVGGAKFGGQTDLPAFGPMSYQQPGVPAGILSEKITHTSKIYDAMQSDYWIYVPAQYDPKVPAALMVFQDGGAFLDRQGRNPALNVIDNLIAQKQIPVMICVFTNPGEIGGAPGTPTYNFVKRYADKWQRELKDSMRSTLYDTVSDRYARFLRDEILADVQAKYNIRRDAYSRAIMGVSSGGICAFNAAWQMTDQFSRVISWIGSFVSIQWKEDPSVPDGGQEYPHKILREPKRNIRVWLQDGSQDMSNSWYERRYGNWTLANIHMANALKLADYDFHFSFGNGTHSGAHGAAEFPAQMSWLWREYDPAKTEQNYEMESEEKAKPLFLVGITNRETQ